MQYINLFPEVTILFYPLAAISTKWTGEKYCCICINRSSGAVLGAQFFLAAGHTHELDVPSRLI